MAKGSSAFWAWVVAAACVLVALACLDKSCRDDAALAAAKADYEEMRRVAEADHALSMGRIDELTQALGHMTNAAAAKDAEIAQYVEKVSTYKAKLTASDAEAMALRTKVQPVLDANPAMAEFVASLDAGIALRDNLIVEQDTLITAQRERIRLGDERLVVQTQIGDEWRASYEREHTLRLAAEDLFKLSERRGRASKLWRTAAVVAGAVAIGAVVSK